MVVDLLKKCHFLRNTERSLPKNPKNLPMQQLSFFYIILSLSHVKNVQFYNVFRKLLRSTTIYECSKNKTNWPRKTPKNAHGNGPKQGEKNVHTILTTIKTHFFHFPKNENTMQIKKIDKYPITWLPWFLSKSEPPDPDYHDPRFLTPFFDLDFLRSPRKSMKNDYYANANPDFL